MDDINKSDMTLSMLSFFAPTFLRVGMSLIFLWFGFSQIIDARSWIGYLPEWTSKLPISAENFIFLNGVFEIIFGILLLIGLFTRISAFLLGIHLLGIAMSLGLTATGVRDFGLTFATIYTFLNGPDAFCIEKKYPNISSSKILKTIIVGSIIALVLIATLSLKGDITENSIDGESGKIPTTPANTSKNQQNDTVQASTNNSQNQQQKTTQTPENIPENPGEVNKNQITVSLTAEEVAKHNKESDCWLIIENKVYDVTSYIPFHPGGKREIIDYCGTDSTIAFDSQGKTGKTGQHSKNAEELLNDYYIGDLDQAIENQTPNNTNPQPSNPPAEPEENTTPTSTNSKPYEETILAEYPGATITKLKVKEDGTAEFKFTYEGETYEGKMNAQYEITKIE